MKQPFFFFFTFFCVCEEERSHAAPLLILMDSVKEHQMKGGQRKISTGFGGNPHSKDGQMDAPMGCRLLSQTPKDCLWTEGHSCRLDSQTKH